MRTKLTILTVLAVFAIACGGAMPPVLALDPPATPSAPTAPVATVSSTDDWNNDDGDLPERDEIRKTVDLAPGTRVEVSSINGNVTAETTTGNSAEIYIVRSAKRKADLEYRRIFVEEGAGFLKIRGENERGRTPDVRQRVVLKLPRSVDVSVRGVNGRVKVGEIDGTIHVSGINGAVDVAHAMSASDVSGINGRVRIGLVRLANEGLDISGINGKVELYFAEALSADISVTGINGNVYAGAGGITVIGKMNPSSFRGRIGQGGPLIKVSGINGNIDLLNEGGSPQ